jgi:Protein of unknown function (DUF2637)
VATMKTPQTSKKRTREPGRGWSTFGFAVGVGASIAANIAHSYVPPSDANGTWHPYAGAIVAAAFWPIAVVISIEVISRVHWRGGFWWGALRYGGLSTVATIAALISYRHLSALMTYYGEDSLSATVGPLAVDGLMVVCSVALLAIGDNVRRRSEAAALVVVTPEPAPTTAPAPAVEPAAIKKPAVPRKSLQTAKKVARTAARMPDAKPAKIAAALDVSEATVRRYLPTAEPAALTVNGHSFSDQTN